MILSFIMVICINLIIKFKKDPRSFRKPCNLSDSEEISDDTSIKNQDESIVHYNNQQPSQNLTIKKAGTNYEDMMDSSYHKKKEMAIKPNKAIIKPSVSKINVSNSESRNIPIVLNEKKIDDASKNYKNEEYTSDTKLDTTSQSKNTISKNSRPFETISDITKSLTKHGEPVAEMMRSFLIVQQQKQNNLPTKSKKPYMEVLYFKQDEDTTENRKEQLINSVSQQCYSTIELNKFTSLTKAMNQKEVKTKNKSYLSKALTIDSCDGAKESVEPIKEKTEFKHDEIKNETWRTSIINNKCKKEGTSINPNEIGEVIKPIKTSNELSTLLKHAKEKLIPIIESDLRFSEPETPEMFIIFLFLVRKLTCDLLNIFLDIDYKSMHDYFLDIHSDTIFFLLSSCELKINSLYREKQILQDLKEYFFCEKNCSVYYNEKYEKLREKLLIYFDSEDYFVQLGINYKCYDDLIKFTISVLTSMAYDELN